MTERMDDAIYMVTLEHRLRRAEIDLELALIDADSWRTVARVFGVACMAIVLIAALSA